MVSSRSGRVKWRRAGLAAAGAALLCLAPPPVAAQDEFGAARAQLVREIEQDVRRTAELLKRAALRDAVLGAMATVPRHRFVPPAEIDRAYLNRPLPIGHGQTISQPYIVAIMTDLLDVEAGGRVLEIGTGSGYQAAVLAALGIEVWSIEIIEPLATEASRRLAALGYDAVRVRHGDGYYGWPEQAPFDGIVVTAAASHIPPPLIRQLRPGGRMVIPVGSRFAVQELILVTREDGDRFSTRQLLPVRFVPLTGGH